MEGSHSNDENDDDSGSDLQDFIDDSEDYPENDFIMNRKIEIELNREVFVKFMSAKSKEELANIGLRFIYSHPKDLFK